MKFIFEIKDIVIVLILLILCPLNSEAKNNNAQFDSLVVVLKDYVKDREDKNRFVEEVEKFKITGNRYKLFVENLTDSIRTDFYLALATLDNEKDDWFQEESLDFIQMSLSAATNKEDSVLTYEAIVLSYFKKILDKQDAAEVSSIKKYLDKVIIEVNGIESESEKINVLKVNMQHNHAIIERLVGNYKRAEDLLKPLTIMSNNFGTRASRIEKTTNSMNELGRVYLSDGIVNSNDKLIEKAIEVFDEAINILENENCSPYHLEELYQRKQKAFFLLERSNDAVALVDKLNTFSTERCYKLKIKLRSINWVFYQSILYDFPNIELVEDISLSIH